MTTIIYLRTGDAYRVADSLTLADVNDALNGNQDRFIPVPLAPAAAVNPGTPGTGQDVEALYITPDSVSHFIVIAD